MYTQANSFFSLAQWSLCVTSLWWSQAELFWAGLASLRLIHAFIHTLTHTDQYTYTQKNTEGLTFRSVPKRASTQEVLCSAAQSTGSLDCTWPDARTNTIHRHDGYWMIRYWTFWLNVPICKTGPECCPQTHLNVSFSALWWSSQAMGIRSSI